MSKKLSILIPVYYNEQSIPLLFAELLKVEEQLEQREVKLELIFIDDGSGDNSLQELKKLKQEREDIRIIKHSRNFGTMHALKSGFQLVTGDCFMLLAADLQDPPELIVQMVDKWLAGSKYVVGERIAREDPWTSKLFSYFYYTLVRLFVIKDYPNGVLMDKAMLPYLQQSGKNINVNLFSYWLGFKPAVIPYKRQARLHGKSRWTFLKKLKLFLDSILGFSIVPIRLISLVGIIVSLGSFSYGILIVINALLGNVPVMGFASFLLGLIIVMLGIIGEYIWRIFDEINKRPESVIDEIY